MRCFHPVDAFQQEDGSVIFDERNGNARRLRLRCGQCVGCRLERSRAWAVRCVHEASLHEFNSFVTLTYSDEKLPHSGTLIYRDFQLFMKRLRRKWSMFDVTNWQFVPRYFACGEYGEKLGRPHYHACLFGVDWLDRVPFMRGESGEMSYVSKELTDLWGMGNAWCGDVTFNSAAYVARYVMKKVNGELADSHYMKVDPFSGEIFDLEPEMAHMSLKPGIGFRWIERHLSEVYKARDGVVMNGMKCKAPRYYDQYLDRVDGFELDEIKFRRFERAMASLDDCAPDRLAVQEICAKARLSFYKRELS